MNTFTKLSIASVIVVSLSGCGGSTATVPSTIIWDQPLWNESVPLNPKVPAVVPSPVSSPVPPVLVPTGTTTTTSGPTMC